MTKTDSRIFCANRAPDSLMPPPAQPDTFTTRRHNSLAAVPFRSQSSRPPPRGAPLEARRTILQSYQLRFAAHYSPAHPATGHGLRASPVPHAGHAHPRDQPPPVRPLWAPFSVFLSGRLYSVPYSLLARIPSRCVGFITILLLGVMSCYPQYRNIFIYQHVTS